MEGLKDGRMEERDQPRWPPDVEMPSRDGLAADGREGNWRTPLLLRRPKKLGGEALVPLAGVWPVFQAVWRGRSRPRFWGLDIFV